MHAGHRFPDILGPFMRPKILVIDDDQQVLSLSALLLKRQAYEVSLALSTAEAKAWISKEKFQLVLSDFDLKDGTAEDVVLAVKRSQPDTPILIMSGDCKQIPTWLTESKIVAKVISKPFDVSLLLTTIREVLNQSLEHTLSQLHPSPLAGILPLPTAVEAMVHRVVDQESIIAITDKRGDIVYANDRFCEISGYARSELIGRNHRILKSGEHPQEFYKNLWSTILSGKTWQGEICNKAKNGRHYYVDTTISPLRDEGLISHFVAVRTDITARREAQLALAQQKQQEEADKRMAALGRMADGVVHDLSNILTGMMGVASEPEGKDRNNILQNSINRMAQLTRTLRDYSTGRPTLPEPFRINSVLSSACSLVRHRKGTPRGLSLTEQLEGSQGSLVLGNEGQIFEIVLNLLVNALDATQKAEKAHISIRSSVKDSQVYIEIEDNGPGVPAAMVSTLFDPYASSKGPGRGVGLSVAYSIAIAHEGSLRLKHAGGDGRGALFEFNLPVKDSPLLAPVQKEPPSLAAQRGLVLVCEDEIEIRRRIIEDLEQEGLTAINVADAADLLALAAKTKEVLKATILDHCDLESDKGMVACLRKIAPSLPIICISASMPHNGRWSTPWGEIESLPKPFISEDFIRTVNEVIERK